MSNLMSDMTDVLNRHSAENGSDTPDFILAQFLIGCLQAWDGNVTAREIWYGRDKRRVDPNSTQRPPLPRDEGAGLPHPSLTPPSLNKD